MRSKGFGRACPTCGRSQYDHPNGKLGRDWLGNRGCDLRLISYHSITAPDGEVIYMEGYAPEEPYPRTKQDPRSYVHVSNLKKMAR